MESEVKSQYTFGKLYNFISCTAGKFFTIGATRETHLCLFSHQENDDKNSLLKYFLKLGLKQMIFLSCLVNET